MSYVLSTNNRWYCGLEDTYGQVPVVTASNRIPAIRMKAHQKIEKFIRRDKTGGRSYAGNPPGGRRETEFALSTYLMNWANQQALPAYGPLFYAAMGATPLISSGGTAASGSGVVVTYSAPHALIVDQAVSSGGEIRFVTNIIDATNVAINAPFSTALQSGSVMSPTVTFLPGDELPSCSLFDYWSPATALQRIISGAGINELLLHVSCDFQEFHFSGVAQDIVDSASFLEGDGQLSVFPAEPATSPFEYSIVPGNLGQIWMGAEPNRFATMTDASLRLINGLEPRTCEFGSSLPRFLSPGVRTVTFDFSVLQQDDQATTELYQAARQNSTIPVMLQVGQSAGQLFGAYMKSVLPEVPQIDDAHNLVRWKVSGSRAQGLSNDELVVAFA